MAANEPVSVVLERCIEDLAELEERIRPCTDFMATHAHSHIHVGLVELILARPAVEDMRAKQQRERAATKETVTTGQVLCPACNRPMSPQCGARCQSCGFKTSCSADPE